MALKAAKAAIGSLSNKFFLQVLIGQSKGDIHQGSTLLIRRSLVKITGINIVVEDIRLFLVSLFHGGESAHGFFDPFEHQLDRIDAKGWWCIIQGLLFEKCIVIEHGGESLRNQFEHVVPDDGHTDAWRADILLGAAVYHCEFVYIQLTGENIG